MCELLWYSKSHRLPDVCLSEKPLKEDDNNHVEDDHKEQGSKCEEDGNASGDSGHPGTVVLVRLVPAVNYLVTLTWNRVALLTILQELVEQ